MESDVEVERAVENVRWTMWRLEVLRREFSHERDGSRGSPRSCRSS